MGSSISVIFFYLFSFFISDHSLLRIKEPNGQAEHYRAEKIPVKAGDSLQEHIVANLVFCQPSPVMLV